MVVVVMSDSAKLCLGKCVHHFVCLAQESYEQQLMMMRIHVPLCIAPIELSPPMRSIAFVGQCPSFTGSGCASVPPGLSAPVTLHRQRTKWQVDEDIYRRMHESEGSLVRL